MKGQLARVGRCEKRLQTMVSGGFRLQDLPRRRVTTDNSDSSALWAVERRPGGCRTQRPRGSIGKYELQQRRRLVQLRPVMTA